MKMKEMKKSIVYSLLAAAALCAAPGMAQSTSSMVVEVKAVTGVSTQGLTVELYGEDSGWVFDPVKVNASGVAKFTYVPAGVFTLTVDGSPLGLEKYVDDNVVHPAGDTIRVMLREAVRVPYALKAQLSHDDFTGANTASVSWNRETDYFFDDFESYEPFAIEFSPWTGYDLDREPAAEITGYYPNRGTQQYATIFNALTIDPPVYYEYEVLRPYSGKQYVGFVRTRSGNANNDWLISPKIKVGVNNIVSFMAKAAEYQPDRFSVHISTTGTEIKDFTQLTPGNYQTVDYKGWQEISYNLSNYEGKEVYIAIHCVSQNSFMLMVDDFYVGPANLAHKAKRVTRRSAANPNEVFVLTLDGQKAGETEEYDYTFGNIAAGKHTIGVKAKYLQAESAEATIDVEVPGAENFASLTLKLAADNGASTAGQAVSLINIETAKQTTANAGENGEATIGFLEKGQYMLNVSSELFDEYNTSFTLDKDMSLDITLKETITDPYNVIYQTTEGEDGKAAVELWWNQDLGFRDSFENYEDFTQQIGDWTVIDGDKMPTYAFSIGGVMIEKPTMRGEVGAMVFNPYSTRPIQASEDGLFLAPDGDKYVMFNSAEAAKSDDWLITPTQKIGPGYVLRFTAKSYVSTYLGTFEFLALKDNDVSTGEVLDAFKLTEDWMRYEIPLNAYEGQSIEIAFHHTTYDGWLSFVDDVYIGPGEDNSNAGGGAANCTFDVFVDGAFKSNVKEPYIKLEGLAPGTHVAGIQAVYASGKKSNVTELTFSVEESGVEAITTDKNDGIWRVYDLNGVEMKGGELPAGIYLRINGNKTDKVIVK